MAECCPNRDEEPRDEVVKSPELSSSNVEEGKKSLYKRLGIWARMKHRTHLKHFRRFRKAAVSAVTCYTVTFFAVLSAVVLIFLGATGIISWEAAGSILAVSFCILLACFIFTIKKIYEKKLPAEEKTENNEVEEVPEDDAEAVEDAEPWREVRHQVSEDSSSASKYEPPCKIMTYASVHGPSGQKLPSGASTSKAEDLELSDSANQAATAATVASPTSSEAATEQFATAEEGSVSSDSAAALLLDSSSSAPPDSVTGTPADETATSGEMSPVPSTLAAETSIPLKQEPVSTTEVVACSASPESAAEPSTSAHVESEPFTSPESTAELSSSASIESELITASSVSPECSAEPSASTPVSEHIAASSDSPGSSAGPSTSALVENSPIGASSESTAELSSSAAVPSELFAASSASPECSAEQTTSTLVENAHIASAEYARLADLFEKTTKSSYLRLWSSSDSVLDAPKEKKPKPGRHSGGPNF